MSGGTSIADVIIAASKYNLNRSWLLATLQRYPGLYDGKALARKMYRHQAAVA